MDSHDLYGVGQNSESKMVAQGQQCMETKQSALPTYSLRFPCHAVVEQFVWVQSLGWDSSHLILALSCLSQSKLCSLYSHWRLERHCQRVIQPTYLRDLSCAGNKPYMEVPLSPPLPP